ncbi:glycosyltransferase WbsX family protein [Phocaeicola abscessus]
MKKSVYFIVTACIFLLSCSPKSTSKEFDMKSSSDYIVAAYIWPSCHNDPMGEEVLWPEKTGEWEIIKKGNPRFEGHYQPKVPLWGYELDDDPKVMEKWINAAIDNGINTFIFDWYWFNNGPFLEGCLNDGFLKAPNNKKMNFYVMWADHDVARNYWNVHRYKDDNSRLWNGNIDWPNWKIIVKRIIGQYFSQSNYLKFDGKPIFSIYSIENLIKTFGSVEETKKGLDYFSKEAKTAGFPGVHFQVIASGEPREELADQISTLGINSVTQYNWGSPIREDYVQWGEEAWERIGKWDKLLNVPFFPNASISYDDSPRFPDKGPHDLVHFNKTPTSFAAYLQRAKTYCDTHPDQPKLITIYAMNEWVEGAYLLPDMEYGYDYLNAVRDVMLEGKYERYTK